MNNPLFLLMEQEFLSRNYISFIEIWEEQSVDELNENGGEKDQLIIQMLAEGYFEIQRYKESLYYSKKALNYLLKNGESAKGSPSYFLVLKLKNYNRIGSKGKSYFTMLQFSKITNPTFDTDDEINMYELQSFDFFVKPYLNYVVLALLFLTTIVPWLLGSEKGFEISVDNVIFLFLLIWILYGYFNKTGHIKLIRKLHRNGIWYLGRVCNW